MWNGVVRVCILGRNPIVSQWRTLTGRWRDIAAPAQTSTDRDWHQETGHFPRFPEACERTGMLLPPCSPNAVAASVSHCPFRQQRSPSSPPRCERNIRSINATTPQRRRESAGRFPPGRNAFRAEPSRAGQLKLALLAFHRFSQ